MARPKKNGGQRDPHRAILTASKMPPAADRRCVREGLGVVMPGGSVKYDWDKVKCMYLIGPSDSIVEFCSFWEIPFETAKGILKASERSEIQRGFRVDWRSAVVRASTISRMRQAEADGARLRKILEDIYTVSEGGVAYARARMFKYRDGAMVVNPALDPKEVKVYLDIAANSAKALRDAFEVDKMSGFRDPAFEGADPEPLAVLDAVEVTETPEPKPVPLISSRNQNPET